MTSDFPDLPPLLLTAAESFTLHRRREGLTQRQAAELYGVGLQCVADWERGKRDDVPDTELGSLTVGEWCRLQRTRRGELLDDVAGVLGVSAAWITRVERNLTREANQRTLAKYWLDRANTEELTEEIDEAVADGADSDVLTELIGGGR